MGLPQRLGRTGVHRYGRIRAALVERGVPFTFTTVEPGAGHLQAVIGYDGRRGTLLIREPSMRVCGEALADKILHRYRGFGPRGMAMAPQEESARLEGIALPDAHLWDRLHAFDGALSATAATKPGKSSMILAATAPGHRITRDARARLAGYDANTAERLEAVESLLELAGDDPCLQLDRLNCLRGLSQRADRLAVFENLCAQRRPTRSSCNGTPTSCGSTRSRLPDAELLAKRALRAAPIEAGNYYVLAGIYWDQRRFAEAMELYRFAACLNDTEENFARSYFIAAQWFTRTEEALQFLRSRSDRFGAKSWQPARTLVPALMHLNRSQEAMETIDKALRGVPRRCRTCPIRRQDLFVAGWDPRGQGSGAAGRDRVEGRRAGSGCGRPPNWRNWKAAAVGAGPLAGVAGNATVGGRRPLRGGRALAEQQGRAAGLAHLEQAVAKFPHFQPLYRLWAQRLHEEPATIREPIFRRILDPIPTTPGCTANSAFSWSTSAALPRPGRRPRSRCGWNRTKAPTYHLRAVLLCREGRIAEAKESLRQTLAQAIDNGYAAHELLRLCDSLAQRREALDFIRDELKRQVTFGDGLLTFRELAHGILDSTELLAVLQEAVASSPRSLARLVGRDAATAQHGPPRRGLGGHKPGNPALSAPAPALAGPGERGPRPRRRH